MKTYRNRGSRHTKKRATRCAHSKHRNKRVIVSTMLEMINAVKVYHWNTRSFAEHKATDELYGKLNEHVDQFVEVLLGKQGDRLDRLDRRIELLQPKDKTDFKNRIFQYRAFLMHLDTCLHDKRDTDLLSIRDDILSDVNQFIYLLTFDK